MDEIMSFNPIPLKYRNDDKPGAWPMLMYGLQWFLITIPIVLIISAVVGEFQLNTLAERTFYTQKLFALTGAGLVIQFFRASHACSYWSGFGAAYWYHHYAGFSGCGSVYCHY
jgi:hypothetical protein